MDKKIEEVKEERKVVKYSWQEFASDVDKASGLIIEYVKNYKEITGKKITKIYGVPRSGLMLAVPLSHRTGLWLTENRDEIDETTLVVDDICDSGETLKKVLKGKKAPTFCLYTKVNSKFFVTLVYKMLDADAPWLFFPWETLNSSKYDRTVK